MTPAEVRAWAVLNGFPQLEGKRGRLPTEAIEAFNNRNNGLSATGGTRTPGPGRQSVQHDPQPRTNQRTCRSVITLPRGLTAKAVLESQNYLCSGCDENPATEVVSLLDGQRPETLYEYTGLCGYCLCEWRKRVK